MSRNIKITVELSDKLCDWVESLIFSEEVPVEAEVEDEEPRPEPIEEKDRQCSNIGKFSDPEHPMGSTVHETFIRLYHLPRPKILDRCNRFLPELKIPTHMNKPEMVDRILDYMYGDDAKSHLSSRFERYTAMAELAVELVQASGRPMQPKEVRDELYKDFMFNPHHIYDGLSRMAQKGILERVGDKYVYAPKPSTVYSYVSYLTNEAIAQLDPDNNTLRDAAVLITADLGLKDTSQDCAKLKAAMMHVITSGIFEPNNGEDRVFAENIDEDLLVRRCKEWLRGMKG